MIFEQIRNKIYPWIKVWDETNSPSQVIELSHEDSPVMRNWLGNLIILYAVDEGNRFTLLPYRDLPPTYSENDLYAIAISNLERDIEFRFLETGFGGYGLVAGGDHETGSVTLPEVWKWCADQIDDNLVVALPAKDLIMMVPASAPYKINALKDYVDQIFQDGDRLLTRQLYYFDKLNATWTIWQVA
jgi:hypothetical protein